ncbi:hypothetical protein SM124_01085 [Bacillus sp. 31A1R]|uniref:Uncharacterized protein n=1 Tax=Robertmurraya mangrovi TaxID=3098077 RepID=A0ABU5IT84_9BACI|nr:hypothetical protein [Bacillus sp. 31A1R]MDZ5470331.1 hypothetical protein [Bacillus sp. 31A1R]
MDKAVIIRPFGFLGFHLCMKLLDEGIEVVGIHIGGSSHSSSSFEEKRMEIGRNANFIETDYLSEELEHTSVIFIDAYDLYFRGNKQEILIYTNIIKSIQKKTTGKIIFLLPNQILLENNEVHNKHRHMLTTNSIQEIYLPTVFGPWQPEEFTFQHFLVSKLKGNSEWTVNKTEDTEDAIFVRDVVEAIFELITNSDEKIVIKHQEKNSWYECAQYLKIPTNQGNNKKLVSEGNIKIKRIQPGITAEEGLEEQKRQIKHLIEER